MLLKVLRTRNFRQFIGEQSVEFASDDDKNVTVIMGENGSGKTTFAQAFTWCLYGETDFDDKSMLNHIVEKQLRPGNEASVQVELELTHCGVSYIVAREQIYKRDASGKMKPQSASVAVTFKKDGQQEFVKQLEVETRIKQILPRELSRYFFFDGERIGNLSKEIRRGRSQEFAQAVRGLLGLNAFIAAMEHLKPTSKNGVIGSYDASYDARTDDRIARYTKTIEEARDNLNRIHDRLAEIETEVQLARDRCEELNLELSGYAETEKLLKEKEKLLQALQKSEQARTSVITAMLKQININVASYFAKSLIRDALESLSKAEKLDKGIPDMHTRTIEFLIKRGACVCGNKIEIGNDAYNELNKALAFLPPQSIGAIIAHFVKESELRTRSAGDFFESFSGQYAIVREYEDRIDAMKADIQTIEKSVAGKERGAAAQQELWRYEKIIRERQAERDDLNRQKGVQETSRERATTERAQLTLLDEKNKKIEVYKAYAQYLFDEISRVYKQNEDEVRNRLQQNINDIFQSIYEGGMSLAIDEKYGIQVIVRDQGGEANDVETSTAQSISVILAFIAGIIKMARENNLDREADTRMLESEPYPLVMDAPLSAFDKRRIKSVCSVLPGIAEQVIIFIKDVDGELAEENMGAKVGKRYFFDKRNEFETHLMAR